MPHIVLLGDSIFDNAAYVRGGPDVVAQLRTVVPDGTRATLLAVDGAVTASVRAQITRLPSDTTHLALSVGGNDALRHIGLLERRARHGAEVLGWFADAADEFAAGYQVLVRQLRETRHPLVLCTIYNGNLDASIQPAARAALAIFNDVIQRAAIAVGAPVVELRDICSEPGDYANPIEPSVQGGAKIAQAIASWVMGDGMPR